MANPSKATATDAVVVVHSAEAGNYCGPPLVCSLNIVPQLQSADRRATESGRTPSTLLQLHSYTRRANHHQQRTRRRWALSPSLTRGRASACAYSSCTSINTLHRHHAHRRRHRRSPRSFTHAPVAAMQDIRRRVSLPRDRHGALLSPQAHDPLRSLPSRCWRTPLLAATNSGPRASTVSANEPARISLHTARQPPPLTN